ncbi:MAG: glutathione S-transferase, partial [Burkholderiales bacterium]|nr:glutathione S-transferase [Burkholderiales bacterium]
MKLYWSTRSPFARKVMIFAHEAGLADHIECVRTFVTMSRPNRELMRENPLGKIPTLIADDGKVLYDSTVICEYLDSLHDGPRLFPAPDAARWEALRRHALGDNMLDNLVLWRNERTRPQAQQSAEMHEAFDIKIRTAVSFLEHEADDLVRTPVGIGHVAIGCVLGYIDFRFPELAWRDGHARLAAWYGAFEQ